MAKKPANLLKRAIHIRGASEHNLKGIDLTIPHDELVVITGLSGSGKSSLAFDTIFAEGQRKYMSSLSAYARQFLDQMKKPSVEGIEGLRPTIAIEQRGMSSNPRSTVATVTEIHDYLRLLFARCGTPHCWAPTKTKADRVLKRCGCEVRTSHPSGISDAVCNQPEGTRLMVLAPVVQSRKGFHADILAELVRKGFVRARVNGEIVDLVDNIDPEDVGENPLNLGRYEKHDIFAVVDRLVIRDDVRSRLAEAVETALKLSEGTVVISTEQQSTDAPIWRDTLYSEKHACPDHPEYALPELEPRLFSFNAPQGACSKCAGLGTLLEFDEALVMPDTDLSLKEGAVAIWARNGPMKAWFNRILRKFCRQFGVTFTQPVNSFPGHVRHILLHGTGGKPSFDGAIPQATKWWQTTENDNVRDWLSTFMSQSPCPACHGDRLALGPLSVYLSTTEPLPDDILKARKEHGLSPDPLQINIADFLRLSIRQAVKIADHLNLSGQSASIAEPILREVRARLGFLESVGLEYLSLNRRAATLSGGEAQRVRLGTQVGSGLVGSCYVLDEPTIGLHQRDNDRLIRTLRHLTDIGNTVIVVEHDEDMIRHADHLIDMGPAAGIHGGQVVAQGTVKTVEKHKDSLTGNYLSGRKRIEIPKQRRPLNEKHGIHIRGAKENNLQNINVAFPLGGIICVTGVSGSGKSTLVNDILLNAVKRDVHQTRVRPGAHKSIANTDKISRVVEVDQQPIGRTPRSNPATYVGFFDEIRKLFSATREARTRGWKPGRFSFNVKGGRCEACQGQGTQKIAMHFLPDVFVDCDVCLGSRYNRETLEVTWKGKTIADVLAMDVEEALKFFEAQDKIARCLSCLHDVGLDYLRLGQPSTELSGGEAQRVKLASELSLVRTEPTLYVLDEPTTGLHFEDVRKLIEVLQRLADSGHSLVVIEHNLDVIKCADWIIDLGPEGGARGGEVLATGTPETIAQCKNSATGQYLKKMLSSATRES